MTLLPLRSTLVLLGTLFYATTSLPAQEDLDKTSSGPDIHAGLQAEFFFLHVAPQLYTITSSTTGVDSIPVASNAEVFGMGACFRATYGDLMIGAGFNRLHLFGSDSPGDKISLLGTLSLDYLLPLSDHIRPAIGLHVYALTLDYRAEENVVNLQSLSTQIAPSLYVFLDSPDSRTRRMLSLGIKSSLHSNSEVFINSDKGTPRNFERAAVSTHLFDDMTVWIGGGLMVW